MFLHVSGLCAQLCVHTAFLEDCSRPYLFRRSPTHSVCDGVFSLKSVNLRNQNSIFVARQHSIRDISRLGLGFRGRVSLCTGAQDHVASRFRMHNAALSLHCTHFAVHKKFTVMFYSKQGSKFQYLVVCKQRCLLKCLSQRTMLVPVGANQCVHAGKLLTTCGCHSLV